MRRLAEPVWCDECGRVGEMMGWMAMVEVVMDVRSLSLLLVPLLRRRVRGIPKGRRELQASTGPSSKRAADGGGSENEGRMMPSARLPRRDGRCEGIDQS